MSRRRPQPIDLAPEPTTERDFAELRAIEVAALQLLDVVANSDQYRKVRPSGTDASEALKALAVAVYRGTDPIALAKIIRLVDEL